MRASAITLLRQVAEREDMAQILTAIGIHDDGRFQRGWIRIIPEEKLFSITSKGYFNQMSQYPLPVIRCPLPVAECSLAASVMRFSG